MLRYFEWVFFLWALSEVRKEVLFEMKVWFLGSGSVIVMVYCNLKVPFFIKTEKLIFVVLLICISAVKMFFVPFIQINFHGKKLSWFVAMDLVIFTASRRVINTFTCYYHIDYVFTSIFCNFIKMIQWN